MKQDTAALGPIPKAIEDVIDLVDRTTIARGPISPLSAIQRTKITRLSGPFIPN